MQDQDLNITDNHLQVEDYEKSYTKSQWKAQFQDSKLRKYNLPEMFTSNLT